MKLIIEIACSQFPMMYQMLGVSLIKQALSVESMEYYNKLYRYDENKSNKQPKNFCFTMRALDYELTKDEFKVKGKVVMVISSPDQELMIHLYNGLLKTKVFKYRYYELKINKIYLKQHKEVKRTPVILKTQSPVYIKNNKNESLELQDLNYQKELNYICNETLKAYRGYGLQEMVALEAIDMKKKVVKQSIRGFTEKGEGDIYCTNCYEGIFRLVGEVEDIKDLIQLGIGFRRGQGYGLVELV